MDARLGGVGEEDDAAGLLLAVVLVFQVDEILVALPSVVVVRSEDPRGVPVAPPLVVVAGIVIEGKLQLDWVGGMGTDGTCWVTDNSIREPMCS